MIENPGLKSPYCPVCESCGEDGCCSALTCKQSPGGLYCKTYLNDLRFGYANNEALLKIIYSDEEKYKDLVEAFDKIWDKNYDLIYK